MSQKDYNLRLADESEGEKIDQGSGSLINTQKHFYTPKPTSGYLKLNTYNIPKLEREV